MRIYRVKHAKRLLQLFHSGMLATNTAAEPDLADNGMAPSGNSGFYGVRSWK